MLRAPRLRLLRFISIISIVIVILEALYSRYAWSNLPEHLIELLMLSGVNAVVEFPESVFLAYPYIQVILLLALIVPIKFSRGLFLANVVLYQSIFVLSGISIGLAGQSLFFVLQTLCYGGIVLLLATRRMAM